MRPLYEAFGLRVGTVVQGMSPDDRRRAYQCDVTYCTNKEVVFDYLKDRLVLGQQPGYIQMQLERLSGSHARIDRLLLRGLPFAIVDEADSILIDEARTPLIISGPADNSYETQVYEQALAVAKALRPGEDFTIEEGKRTLDLTEEGKHRVRDLAQPLGPVWTGTYRREEMIRQALTAMHLFCRDREYIVRDDKIQIVDEYTGRTMADRSWERGLHQLIEAKEGCKITAQNETLARISYQRFFRRYRHLAGMTGTAREVANELWSVYRLNVVPIPTNRPLARIGLPERICLTAEEKWSEIVAAISELNGQGRPVLVGTRSVAASEQLSALLTGSGLPHRVLNARQDKEEAEIIAGAGQGGRITVATNMAGRGTDISLGADVRERGGLHVIATELHDAKRIDRQLFGRCGRQGDPGSYQAIVSLEDDLLKSYGEKALGRIISGWVQNGSAYGQRTAKLFASYVQHTAQRKHFHMRRDLLKFDESMESAIAFSGRGE
jgi:preprotein translocase subunit SecA